jgi:beta-glucanase (GH16 family)
MDDTGFDALATESPIEKWDVAKVDSATGVGGMSGSGGLSQPDVAIANGGALGTGGIFPIDGASFTGGNTGMGGEQETGGGQSTGGTNGTGDVADVDGVQILDASDTSVALLDLKPDNDSAPEMAPDIVPDIPVTTPDTAPDLSLLPPDSKDVADAIPIDTKPLHLRWFDEFDGESNTGVDTTKWAYTTWNPGQVNDEKQKYTSRTANVYLDGEGHLVIRALNVPYGAYQYTSGRIESGGKFSFTFGRIEVRAKLPAGIGSFPGIIAMGNANPWPDCGQISLVEQYGQEKNWIYVSAKAGNSPGSGNTGNVKYTFPDAITASSDFHVYSADWFEDHIVFEVDGNEITRTNFNTSSPFHSIPEFLVLDVALGGDMGGTIDPNGFPMSMVVDYVRVYSF